MTTAHPARPGDRVGNYIVEEEIGRGAFGVVYKAHHHTLTDQMVALKVPTNPDVRELMRGGAIQYRVEHSGVVKVVDIDLSADPPFMAMEWVEGQTLRDRMDQAGKITVEAALPILEQILEALDAAHAQGIVHRDLKPANILIDNLGTVKITDFGLGQVEDQVRQSLMLSLSHDDAARAVGTLAYMAPEQRDGQPVDGRADLYAFGIILFEMLTGWLPAVKDSLRFLDIAPQAEEKLNGVVDQLCCPLDLRLESVSSVREQFVDIQESMEFSRQVSAVLREEEASRGSGGAKIPAQPRGDSYSRATPSRPRGNRERRVAMLIGVSYVIVLVSLGVLGWLAHQRNLEAARREAEEMFQRGKRSTDPKQAVKWYRKAADKGDASAMVVLGYRYYNGEGVAKDPTEAVRWWRRAADKGNASAMFNLGWRYANGQGVAKDPKEAVRWWRRAADKGHSGAKMTLERLGR